MHLCDLVQRWHFAGANGPDRFVGDYCVFIVRFIRDGTRELGIDHIQCRATFTLGECFPDADHRNQTCIIGGLCFRGDHLVSLAVIRAPFGMSGQNIACPSVGQHISAEVARVRPAYGRVTILSADIKGRVLAAVDQGGGRADQDINIRIGVFFLKLDKFGQVGAQPVHLPVSGSKFTGHVVVLLSYLKTCYQLREQSERATMDVTIPRIDAAALLAGDTASQELVAEAATGVGFLTVYNTPISTARAQVVLAAYHAFFALPASEKAAYDMAQTGSNRGWGAPGSERVDPDANPDYKQVFDCGLELLPGDPLAALPCYAPNIWPVAPADFATVLRAYYRDASAFALDLLCAIADAVGQNGAYFRDQFDLPMALLRGNFYPTRPAWAGDKDFGIATHTDYGCLTLLATDGSPGLEVRKRGGGWIPVSAPPGEFVINFGEMLEMWTSGLIKATPHRVVGTKHERISVPLFFNPNHDANVAPKGAPAIFAAEHLQRRFDETYVHLQSKVRS